MTVYRVAPIGTKVTTKTEYAPFQGMRYYLKDGDSTLAIADSEQALIAYVERKHYEL